MKRIIIVINVISILVAVASIVYLFKKNTEPYAAINIGLEQKNSTLAHEIKSNKEEINNCQNEKSMDSLIYSRDSLKKDSVLYIKASYLPDSVKEDTLFAQKKGSFVVKAHENFQQKNHLLIVAAFAILLFLILGYKINDSQKGTNYRPDYASYAYALACAAWALGAILSLYIPHKNTWIDAIPSTINNAALLFSTYYFLSNRKWFEKKSISESKWMLIVVGITMFFMLGQYLTNADGQNQKNADIIDLIYSLIVLISWGGFTVFRSFRLRKSTGFAAIAFVVVLSQVILQTGITSGAINPTNVAHFYITYCTVMLMVISIYDYMGHLTQEANDFRHRLIHGLFNNLRAMEAQLLFDTPDTTEEMRGNTILRLKNLQIVYSLLLYDNPNPNPNEYFKRLISKSFEHLFGEERLDCCEINVTTISENVKVTSLQTIGWMITELLMNATKHSPVHDKNIFMSVISDDTSLTLVCKNNCDHVPDFSKQGYGTEFIEEQTAMYNGSTIHEYKNGKVEWTITIPLEVF